MRCVLAVLERELPQAQVLKPADGWVLLPSDPMLARQGLPSPQAEGSLEPLTLVVGVRDGSEAKAFPAEAIAEGKPLLSTVAGRNIAVVREGPAFRVFVLPQETPATLDFTGENLERLPVRTEYWFAWKRAYPETTAAR